MAGIAFGVNNLRVGYAIDLDQLRMSVTHYRRSATEYLLKHSHVSSCRPSGKASQLRAIESFA
jgi:hypothetical protein